MQTRRYYGPTFVLLVTVVGVLLGGPFVMRGLAYAQQKATGENAARYLESSGLSSLSDAFVLVADRVKHGVVNISVKHAPESYSGKKYSRQEELLRRFRERGFPGFPDRDMGRGEDDNYQQYNAMKPYGAGSGWVYDEEGHIITNYHVIKGADVIEVKLYDKSTRIAEVVGVDPKTDIAVLKINKGYLHPVMLNTREVHQGEIVFAFGSPFQFEFSMSQGIVSGIGRRLGILNRVVNGQRVTGYENFIQTDAAINPGNSGGPLTDVKGEVIGMNAAIATEAPRSAPSFAGVGFAIPSDMIENVVTQIIESGKVSRGYLGVYISDEPAMLESFGAEKGAVVQSVEEDMPAYKAGVERGDVIVGINGKRISGVSELRRMISRIKPGVTVEMTILRDGKEITKEVNLAGLPDETVASKEDDSEKSAEEMDSDELSMVPLLKLGIVDVKTMTEEFADQVGIAYQQGVMVLNVRARSIAAMNGIRKGSIIVEVGDTQVTTVRELAEAIGECDLHKGVRLSLALIDGDHFVYRYVILKLDH